MTESRATVPASSVPGLKRSLSLGHATLYGLGVTVGAGIYVLIGAAAAHSAMYALAAFAVAALLIALTAASFAELVRRCMSLSRSALTASPPPSVSSRHCSHRALAAFHERHRDRCDA